MIIKKLQDILSTERDVNWGNGMSRRFLIRDDGLPFTMTETIINPNTESRLQYLNHAEACYCIGGFGEVETNNNIFEIKPGTMYAPEKDGHILRAGKEGLKLVCVFTPPLSGQEHHKLSSDGYSTYSLE